VDDPPAGGPGGAGRRGPHPGRLGGHRAAHAQPPWSS
jgi:hypothetical protein